MADYSGLFVYICLAAAIVAVIVAISGSLSPSRPSAAKSRPYECGVSEIESTQHRWPVRFALVAMLFLIFDVEIVFLLPPWEAIFVNDAERDQTFAEAVTVYDRVTRWYRGLGYTILEVPPAASAERADFVLRALCAGGAARP